MSKTIQPIAFKPAPAKIAGPKVIKAAPANAKRVERQTLRV